MKIEVCKGTAGLALYIDDERVAGVRHNGLMETVLSAIVATPVTGEADVERLTAEVERLTEWKNAIIGVCKACGSDAQSWTGDKTGWGFIFEFIKHLHSRAETAKAEAFEEAAQIVAECLLDNDTETALSQKADDAFNEGYKGPMTARLAALGRVVIAAIRSRAASKGAGE